MSVLACVLLAACASPPTRPPVPDAVGTLISIPLDIGKLKIERSFEFPDPRLGTMYSYAGEFALFADVYIFPNPFIGEAPPAVTREHSPEWAVEGFKSDITYAVEQGAYESAQVLGVSDVSHDWKYGTVVGKQVSLAIAKDGNEMLSRAYFFVLHDKLLKIRISHFDYPGLGENMDWFVDELLGGTRVTYYEEDGGGAMVNIDSDGDVQEQLLSRLDDLYVAKTRNESIEEAIVKKTRDGVVYYGEFEEKEPIMGPTEAQRLQIERNESE